MSKITEEFNNFRRNPILYFDRSFSSGTGKQIGWLVSIFILVLVILYVVFLILPIEGGAYDKFTTMLFMLMSPGESEEMPLVFTLIVDILGLVIFGGMLISVVSNILERRVEAYQNGETSYNFKKHIIIIGYDDSVPSLIKTLRTHKYTKEHDSETCILIQSCQNTSEIRNRLSMSSEDWAIKNTIVVHGQCDSVEDLEALNISKCKAVYIMGDDILEAHDSTNLKSLNLIAEIWNRYCVNKRIDSDSSQLQERLHCHVMFEYQTIFNVFQYTELKKEISSVIRFHPFNLHENWAKKMLVADGLYSDSAFKPLEGENGLCKTSDKHVHVIIVGMSRMGTALAVETAQIAHYPNFVEDKNTTRTHITFIDSNALEEMEIFKSRFQNVFDLMKWRYVDSSSATEELYTLKDENWIDPLAADDSPYRYLGKNFTDIQWEFVNGNIESDGIRKYLTNAVNDDAAITTIAICLPETQTATRAVLYLPDKVLRTAHQVFVYQQKNDEIIRSVNNTNDVCTRYDKVVPFGLTSDNYSNDEIGEEEGKWINAYYAFKYAPDEMKEKCGQKWKEKNELWANALWDETSTSDKWSSMHCANMLYTKLRSIGCTVNDSLDKISQAMNDNMTELVMTEHNRWVAEQLMAGYRPLLFDEWEEYKKSKRPKKKTEKAHGNICSNAMLESVEPDSHDKDAEVTLALLEIIERNRKIELLK